MFVDTSGFLCRFSEKEEFHDRTLGFFNSGDERVTSNYVLAEYTALAQARGLSRSHIIEFSKFVLNDGATEIVWIDARLHQLAVELLKERPDKTYSLCDAASFVIMRDRGLTEALTTDRHFDQEGFVRLLK